jgi:hypothetical protein
MLTALPRNVREQALAAYDLFRSNPRHPSLHFKRVFANDPLVSVRVGRDYRAVGVERGTGAILWFWIGPHESYETLSQIADAELRLLPNLASRLR